MNKALRRIIALIPAAIIQLLWLYVLLRWLSPFSAIINSLLSLFAMLYVLYIFTNRNEGTYIKLPTTVTRSWADRYGLCAYPIESSITAGLCTTNMGDTGDIAVLSAANRMELLPFAQIATRICGALVLIVASILVQILL